METNYKKTLLSLPADVRAVLASTTDVKIRNQYFAALRAGNWTLQAISDASDLTRERVRQIVASVGSDYGDVWNKPAYPVPTPPLKPVKTPRVIVEPDPRKLARALELQATAATRAQAEEFVKLLADMYKNDGVSLYHLGQLLGRTSTALRSRLVRYGYLTATGTSKVYTPILAANRV